MLPMDKVSSEYSLALAIDPEASELSSPILSVVWNKHLIIKIILCKKDYESNENQPSFSTAIEVDSSIRTGSTTFLILISLLTTNKCINYEHLLMVLMLVRMILINGINASLNCINAGVCGC